MRLKLCVPAYRSDLQDHCRQPRRFPVQAPVSNEIMLAHRPRAFNAQPRSARPFHCTFPEIRAHHYADRHWPGRSRQLLKPSPQIHGKASTARTSRVWVAVPNSTAIRTPTINPAQVFPPSSNRASSPRDRSGLGPSDADNGSASVKSTPAAASDRRPDRTTVGQ